MSRSFVVRLSGTVVGHLVPTSSGRFAFRADPSYRELTRRPVLAQRLEDDPTRTWLEAEADLPRWFGHLLPERSGRLRALICEAHHLDPSDEVGLLAAVGHDLAGAVVVEPGDVGDPAGDEAAPDPGEAHPEATSPVLRHSLAGMQLKISVIARDERISLPRRDEDGDHILKIAGSSFPGLAENEAAMMEWARRSGFEVAGSTLVSLREVPDLNIPLEDASDSALLVQRFDRSRQGRIHQEDLAQVVHVPASEKAKYGGTTYLKLARLAKALLGREGFIEYLRRLTLMIAQGNADAHLKNWSLRYQDPTRATWAPLYDQVSTVAWPHLSTDLALRLGTVRQLGQVGRSSIARLAQAAEEPAARCEENVFEVLERLRKKWPQVLERSALFPEHRRLLVEHWRQVPLLHEAGPLAQ